MFADLENGINVGSVTCPCLCLKCNPQPGSYRCGSLYNMLRYQYKTECSCDGRLHCLCNLNTI